MERQEAIHSKGFAMDNNYAFGGPGDQENVANYNKIKVGVKNLQDATITLGD